MTISFGFQINVSIAGVSEFAWTPNGEAEAVDRILFSLPNGAADLEVQVQPGPASKIQFLAIKCEPGDGVVSYKATPAAAQGIAIRGVHIYQGPDMAGLLGPDPTKLFFTHTGTAPADVIILVARGV